MIYAALAAVVCALLAWDFGRRWIATRALDLRKEVDDLRGKYGDVGTQVNLRAQVLNDKIEHLDQAINTVNTLAMRRDDDLSARINELAHPAGPPDLAKFSKALENLVRETREELAKRPTHDDLKTVETRLHGVMTGAVAKGAKRFA